MDTYQKHNLTVLGTETLKIIHGGQKYNIYKFNFAGVILRTRFPAFDNLGNISHKPGKKFTMFETESIQSDFNNRSEIFNEYLLYSNNEIKITKIPDRFAKLVDEFYAEANFEDNNGVKYSESIKFDVILKNKQDFTESAGYFFVWNTCISSKEPIALIEYAIRRYNNVAGVSGGVFKKFRDKGLAKQCYQYAVKFLFIYFNLNRIETGVIPNNLKSISLHNSLGFRNEGYGWQAIKENENYWDVIRYAILREDLDENETKFQKSYVLTQPNELSNEDDRLVKQVIGLNSIEGPMLLKFKNQISNEITNVVDLGSGNGVYSKILGQYFTDKKFILVERNESLLEKSKDLFKGISNIQFLNQDITNMSDWMPSEKSLIVLRLVCQHIGFNESIRIIQAAYEKIPTGSSILIIDTDDSNLSISPKFEQFDYLLKVKQDNQLKRGGDRHIGGKLYNHLNANYKDKLTFEMLTVSSDKIGALNWIEIIGNTFKFEMPKHTESITQSCLRDLHEAASKDGFFGVCFGYFFLINKA